MKLPPRLLSAIFIGLSIVSTHAQDSTADAPEFQIESTQVKRLEVVEAPKLSGLPPTEGVIRLKMHNVAEPKLKTIEPQSEEDQSKSNLDSQVTDEEVIQSSMIFLSATVYDQKRTLLRCSVNGAGDDEITVWSNVNFNHFTGVNTVQVRQANGDIHAYSLIIAIGNEVSQSLKEADVPSIPDGVPAYVIQSKNPSPESLALVESLHVFYRTEGKRLAEESVAREKAYEAEKAYLLANPPKPKDVTIHFWKRSSPENNTPSQPEQP